MRSPYYEEDLWWADRDDEDYAPLTYVLEESPRWRLRSPMSRLACPMKRNEHTCANQDQNQKKKQLRNQQVTHPMELLEDFFSQFEVQDRHQERREDRHQSHPESKVVKAKSAKQCPAKSKTVSDESSDRYVRIPTWFGPVLVKVKQDPKCDKSTKEKIDQKTEHSEVKNNAITTKDDSKHKDEDKEHTPKETLAKSTPQEVEIEVQAEASNVDDDSKDVKEDKMDACVVIMKDGKIVQRVEEEYKDSEEKDNDEKDTEGKDNEDVEYDVKDKDIDTPEYSATLPEDESDSNDEREADE